MQDMQALFLITISRQVWQGKAGVPLQPFEDSTRQKTYVEFLPNKRLHSCQHKILCSLTGQPRTINFLLKAKNKIEKVWALISIRQESPATLILCCCDIFTIIINEVQQPHPVKLGFYFNILCSSWQVGIPLGSFRQIFVSTDWSSVFSSVVLSQF